MKTTHTPGPMKAHEGNMEPWFIEHGLHVTDEQRDILRGIVQERDRLLAVNAELLNACIEAEKYHQGQKSEIGKLLRFAIERNKV